MKNTVTFLTKTYGNNRLKGITAAIDTALNGRSLDVDTMDVELTTGPANLRYWTADPLPKFTREGLRYMTGEDTALGAWNRDEALVLARGGS